MRVLDFVNFKYCPRCGEQRLRSNDAKSFACLSCGFVYYHGSAAVAVGIIEWDDKIILTKRAREPQKGLLALPGGFVDYEESLEGALVRELREELNLTVTTPTYLCSHWERYSFRDVVYFTTIAFYVASANDISNAKANDDIDAFLLVRPKDIDYGKLAFESDRVALDTYRRRSVKGEIEAVRGTRRAVP
jgi:ADP-ribose pyrophosphatase YjhB (NUDIX family)